MKRLFCVLPLAVLAVVLALPPAATAAKNPDWKSVIKQFKENFKTKNSLKVRRAAVKAMVKSEDPRAAKELLKVFKLQQKHARQMREEWVSEEESWQAKTREAEVELAKAIKTGGGENWRPSNQEQVDWVKWLQGEGEGSQPGFIEPKVRIEGLYERVLEEEDFTKYLFKSVARLVNRLEGDEREKSAKQAVSAAKSGKGDQIPYWIHMLTYMKSDQAVDALLNLASSRNAPGTRMMAIEAVGRQNSEKGIPFLIEQLKLEEWQFRASAIKGLSYYRDARVIDALIEGGRTEKGALQRKYFAALARIVQESVPGTVEAWQSYWNDNKDDLIERWSKFPKGEPVETELADIPIDTSLGSTSFYGIQTNSKHLIFVVDVSGSMGDESQKNEQGELRIDVARRELKKAIQSLSAKDEDERGGGSFNIVLYGTLPSVYKPGKMVTATIKNKEKAIEWIEENVKPGDGIDNAQTNIFDAVESAFNVISSTKEAKNLEKGADTIMLMTDGNPSRGKFMTRNDLIVSEIKRMNETRRIIIHAIGVGQHNQMLLGGIAAQNDGQYLSR